MELSDAMAKLKVLDHVANLEAEVDKEMAGRHAAGLTLLDETRPICSECGRPEGAGMRPDSDWFCEKCSPGEGWEREAS